MTQVQARASTRDPWSCPMSCSGAIDIHVHAGPHLKSSPRRVDPLQAAQEAKAAGMRGLVFMDVLENSCGTAWLVSRAVPGIEVFGGIILNTVYGGMNPRAVRTALYYGAGAKFVSFGAHSTYYLASQEGRMVDGKPVPFKDLYPKFAARSWRAPSASRWKILSLLTWTRSCNSSPSTRMSSSTQAMCPRRRRCD